ncbi:MAG TPA: hypothetical protein VNC40_10095 [Gaiellaceae bacterium]|nr:hypothetical protein [Gaiellaceae bacterium]
MTETKSDLPLSVDDEFMTEILPRRRRRLPVLTALLAFLTVAGLAFLGGVEVQKHYGSSSSSSSGGAGAGRAAAFLAARGGGGLGGGRFGGGGFGALGGGASGTVTLIKGSTLYVTNSTGNTTMVRTSASSRVTRSVSGTIKAVHPGDTVSVTGPQAADGSYTARAISITSGGGTSG